MAKSDFLKGKATLTAYSSDGSIYDVRPKAVKPVRSLNDIYEAVKLAHERGLSVIPRGGGTGLTGGALGEGIVLDFSDFRNIIRIDSDSQMVMTQVGIIYDELNLALKNEGLFFPPDPSSGDSCQIGGMIANNSSGPRSVKYGLTSDFIEELDVISSDGERIRLRKLEVDSDELKLFFEEHPEYNKVFDIIASNKELIRERWPKLKKNSAGYNLRQVVDNLDNGVFNLPALIAGSEGTLAIQVTATLKLLPIPQERLTARLYFKSLIDAGRAVSPILKCGPSGLEIVDGATLDLIGRERFDIPDSAAALLIVEFDDNLNQKREDFIRLAESLDLAAPVDIAADADATAALWRARKAIVPTLYRHHETKRPVSLVEDVSLPPDQIPSFIEYVTDLFSNHGLTFGIFGHIGDGNLHLRPLFDLNNANDFKLAHEIYGKIYAKIIEIGGSTTAEHADGRLRASVLKKLYGEQIFSIFKEIKKVLDPDNILSPDSVLSELPFDVSIDYEKIKSFCAACGKCNGYCPAYDIFRREDFSPRGWLRILNQSGADRDELDRYLSFCLNCKNCAIVCPAGVDIASEIMKYRAEKPSRVSSAVVALTDKEAFLNLALKMGKLAEPIMDSSFGRGAVSFLGGALFGLDKTAQFPKIASVQLRKRFADRAGDTGELALFHGCADNLLESEVGDAIFRVFDRLNIRVTIPEQKCCGLPQEVYGHRDNLIEKAKFNIDRLNRFDAVITGCASCLERLREYEKLFEDDDRYREASRLLTDKCFDISQYLNAADIDLSIFDSGRDLRVTYHNPCHLRAAGLHKEPEKLIGKIKGIELIDPVYADRCCTQSGSYGFVHFQESKLMFKKKKDDYNRIKADYIMTSCPACQMKIYAELGGNTRVVHPVQILADRLRD